MGEIIVRDLDEMIRDSVRKEVKNEMRCVFRDQIYRSVAKVGLFVALAFGYCANVHYGFELAKEKGWAGVFDSRAEREYLKKFGVDRRSVEEVSRDEMQ